MAPNITFTLTGEPLHLMNKEQFDIQRTVHRDIFL